MMHRHHHHHRQQRRRWTSRRGQCRSGCSTLTALSLLLHIIFQCIQLCCLRKLTFSFAHAFTNNNIFAHRSFLQREITTQSQQLPLRCDKCIRNDSSLRCMWSVWLRQPTLIKSGKYSDDEEFSSEDLRDNSMPNIQSLQHDRIPAMLQHLKELSSASEPVERMQTTNSALYRTLTKTTLTVAEKGDNSQNQYIGSTTNTTTSTQSLQVALVRLGIIWSQQQKDQTVVESGIESSSESMIHMTSSPCRVSGCISTVHIQTTLCCSIDQEHVNDITSNNVNNRVTITVHSIRGTTDSYMSRGLLACIATLLTNVDVAEIMTIDVPQLIHQLSLESVLSQGRNDGFTNMVRVIQSQAQDCVIRLQQHPTLFNTVSVNMPSTPVKFNSHSTVGLPTNSNTSTSVKTKTRVALLLSGGVDSSVALSLLVRNDQEQYDVTAFYLKIWLEDELSDLNECPWEEDVKYCAAVCQQLNVPLETISLQEEYNDHILSYTINEAKNGRTPNPDILCNRRIKFGCFYDVILNRKFDYIATGHYAQVLRETSSDGSVRAHLHRAPDPVKDQSYFLCALTQEQLKRVLFPIGHLSKVAVRQFAELYELPNRYRPDSQGLCFLGKVKFDAFLNTYIADQPGPIIDATNDDLVGYHRGLWYHTIGQRKGLGKVLFPNATSIGPWYVVGKNTDTNAIYCTNKYEEDTFTQTRSEFSVEAIHWISGTPPLEMTLTPHPDRSFITSKSLRDNTNSKDHSAKVFDLSMKIRHGPNLVRGYLTIYGDGTTNQSHSGFIHLQNSKDSGLAPGQYVSFYNCHTTECYGCAVISENNWAGVTPRRTAYAFSSEAS